MNTPHVIRPLIGWGGTAAITGNTLHMDYEPGIFESTQLVHATMAGLLGVAAAGLALEMPTVALGWLCLTAAILLLVSGGLWWFTALQTFKRAGRREIDLSARTLTADGQTLALAGAIVEVEISRLGFTSVFSRLSLAYPSGRRVPLLQGPIHEVEAFREALVA